MVLSREGGVTAERQKAVVDSFGGRIHTRYKLKLGIHTSVQGEQVVVFYRPPSCRSEVNIRIVCTGTI